MDFSRVTLDADQEQFAKEVHTLLEEIVTEEVHEEERRTGGGFNLGVHLALGARGWLMPTWPVEQGGAGLDRVCARILELELLRFKVPSIVASTTGMVWSAVETYLDAELLADIRPKVAAGQVRFCLGYSEPDGGSDIANAKVRAVQEGDEWVINGSKMWTTGAQHCQYTFIITRTDTEAPKHRGLTMFLLPLDLPGVEVQAVHTYGGERTNATYYGDVRVSDRYRLGPVNGGWGVLHGPLDAEHSVGLEDTDLSDASLGQSFLRDLEGALDAAARWALTAQHADDSRLADDDTVLTRLGHIATAITAASATPGPMGRIVGSDVMTAAAADLVDLVGPAGLLPHGEVGCVADGLLDYTHRFAQGAATYGGTVEVFRSIVAQHVLGLPGLKYPGSRSFLQGRAAAEVRV